MFVGPSSSEGQQKLDLTIIIDAIQQKWSDAVIKLQEDTDVPLRWNVLSESWYLECSIIRGYSVSIRSNDNAVKVETIIWFCGLAHFNDLFLYDANSASNPLRWSEEITSDEILEWLDSL